MKFLHNNNSLKARRKELRNRLTSEEIILWDYLKDSKLGCKFRRQASIGYYVADFYCPKYRYVIELDGSQYLDNKEYDTERDNFLKSKGCFIRRFWNRDIHSHLNGIIEVIKNDVLTLSNTTPPYGHPS